VTVFATTDKSLGAKGIAAFVVPKDSPGFIITKFSESKLGIRSWVNSALLLQDCFIRWRTGWDGRVPGQPRVRRKSMGTAGR